MSYRFNIGEPVSGNVRRIASGEINSAIVHLRGSDPSVREKDIHEARKAIKRVRALLRLVRPELGRCFRRENAALRDVGRSLSDLRDSSIVLQTFDSLSEEASDRKRLQGARDGLQHQKEVKERATDTGKILRKAAAALAEVGERVTQWTLRSDGFEALAEGLKAEYGGGRKAMSKALRANDSLLFHEWRKRAKCQLFHMRLLKNVLPDSLREQEKRLHDLETALGDDHNLLILRQHLEARPSAFGGKKIVRRSLRMVSEREKTLRVDAEALGQKIYTDKPRQFVQLIRAQWEKAATPGAVTRKGRTPAA